MSDNQVWDVYDLLRTVRLNIKYYSAYLVRFAKMRLILELGLSICAIISLSTGILSIGNHSSQIAWLVWLVFSTFTAVLAGLLPFLRLSERESSIRQTLVKYRELQAELEKLSFSIRDKKEYGEEEKKHFTNLVKFTEDIAMEAITLPFNKTLLEEKEQEVTKEFPVSSFFVPGQQSGQ